MVLSSSPQPATRAEVTQAAEPNSVASTAVAPVPPRAAAPAPSGQSGKSNVGFLDLLGATREDRFGVVLIGLGGVAVLYALLTQLRFG
jgi:hypothetical protein